jgi:hypothetical protein
MCGNGFGFRSRIARSRPSRSSSPASCRNRVRRVIGGAGFRRSIVERPLPWPSVAQVLVRRDLLFGQPPRR